MSVSKAAVIVRCNAIEGLLPAFCTTTSKPIMNGSNNPPFRVLIAGGSVAGLVLANALEKAGIDYLVLEKRDLAPNLGASISVLCQTAKVFERLGIWQNILSQTLPLLDRQHFDENGGLFEDTAVLRLLAERTGRPIVFMERQCYLQTLLDNIPGASRWKIQHHTGVEAFQEDEQGVTVVTDKGEKTRGSVLVGADGVHSRVRDLLAKSHKEKDISGQVRDCLVLTSVWWCVLT